LISYASTSLSFSGFPACAREGEGESRRDRGKEGVTREIVRERRKGREQKKEREIYIHINFDTYIHV